MRLRRVLIFFLTLMLFAGVGVWCVRRVGRWLVVEDPLEPAAAIAVLSGRMPVRAIQAAEVYRARLAPKVWLTQAAGPADELEQMGIPFSGEEFYNERVLMHLGVPGSAIHVLTPRIVNTADEVDVIARQMRSEGAKQVILVTSKAHTRRVRSIWRKRVGNSPRAIVRFASADDFDPERWWRHTGNALDVVREVLGLANAWAGFPLQPAS